LGDLSADAKTTIKYMIRRNSFRVHVGFLCGLKRVQWWAVVNTAMNIPVLYRLGISWLPERL